jgi:hypothetical protein
MPAIPAFAAVFAIAGAGAVAGGIGASIATIGFAVVGAVGATIGAVGAITKNKTLQMIGLGLGVVGGVGGIASSAGVFGDAGIFAPGGTAATGATGATDAASAAGAATGATDAAGAVGDTAAQAEALANPASSYGALSPGSLPTDFAAPDFPGGAVPAAANTASLDMAPNAADAKDVVTATTDSTTTAADTTKAPPLPGQPKPDAVQAADAGDPIPPIPPDTPPPQQTPQPWQTGNGKWIAGVNDQAGTYNTGSSTTWLGKQFDGITSWAKDNPVLSSGLISGGFGLLKGLGGTTDAQNAYYNANAQANLSQAKLRDQQFANIAAPKAVAYSPPVGSVPALGTQLPGTAGLINRAPTSAVTGATA